MLGDKIEDLLDAVDDPATQIERRQRDRVHHLLLGRQQPLPMSYSAHERWGASLSDAQAHQLEHELAVIKQLGFAGFFLVMWDAMQFARGRGIPKRS